jgi:hypothetical protein
LCQLITATNEAACAPHCIDRTTLATHDATRYWKRLLQAQLGVQLILVYLNFLFFLPKGYARIAAQIAARRIILAGYRLADLLKRIAV